MEQGQKFPTGVVLGKVADGLKRNHSHLYVTLSSNHATFVEGTSAALQSIAGLPDRLLLPTKNPVHRQKLRELALEHLALENLALENLALENRPSQEPPHRAGRLIRTQGKLSANHKPKPISPEHRALFKKEFYGEENRMLPLRPYALNLRPLLLEDTLATVVAKVSLTAVDFDDGMPECELAGIEMLWDAVTIVTADILSDEFRTQLSGPIHDPYRNKNMTRVQVSFIFGFSNTLFQHDTMALVVNKEFVPNMRSGIILGQRACLNRIQYRAIPRAVLEANGETIGKEFWGDLVIENGVDIDGTLTQL
ncbi:hypothetical protein VN97_g2924 [Penicillium thymicola]|uniref:Uncharacterized protein n=1 Tax=Penicillium thymicola TaxID=293382 RepID=A0AAI9XAZ8_PENTH|nr:hypothetical protein VN97_g2924 [Penicillium thymicola]